VVVGVPGTVFPERFETERLSFERLDAALTPREYYAVVSDRNETVAAETEYLPWTPVSSLGEAADRLAEFERQWDERERAEWCLRVPDREADEPSVAGFAGLLLEWEKDLVLPTIWLRKPYWGRGLSGERADALLEIAFERLDVGVVAIPVHAENDRSYAAVERYVDRYGGRYEGLLRHHAGRYDEPVDHHRFSISRAEYRDAVDERS